MFAGDIMKIKKTLSMMTLICCLLCFFWQALIAEAYGTSFAKEWGDAHESTSTGVDKTMDLLNNDIGRNLGASISGNQQVEARLSSALLTKISNGELWRVVNGQLCATDGTGRK